MPRLLLRSGREITVNESVTEIDKLMRQRTSERERRPLRSMIELTEHGTNIEQTKVYVKVMSIDAVRP